MDLETKSLEQQPQDYNKDMSHLTDSIAYAVSVYNLMDQNEMKGLKVYIDEADRDTNAKAIQMSIDSPGSDGAPYCVTVIKHFNPIINEL